MDKKALFETLERAEHLIELPPSISDIITMLHNPSEADIELLADHVGRAKNLGEILIRHLNSGYYQLSKPIISLRDAVAYLGLKTVRNLLIYYISRQLFTNFPQGSRSRMFDMHRYWRHVLGTALAASMLARQRGQKDRYMIFTYGLIHDIGMALIDACLPGMLDDVMEKINGGIHRLVAERVTFGGLTHAEIGAWLCRRWNLPADITAVVEHHHAPLVAKAYMEDVRLIHVADEISTEYYEKLMGITLNHNISAHIMGSLGITDEDRQEAVNMLPQAVEHVRGYFV